MLNNLIHDFLAIAMICGLLGVALETVTHWGWLEKNYRHRDCQ